FYSGGTTLGGLVLVDAIFSFVYFFIPKQTAPGIPKPQPLMVFGVLLVILIPVTLLYLFDPFSIGWTATIDSQGVKVVVPFGVFDRGGSLSWGDIHRIRLKTYGKWGGIRDLHLMGQDRDLVLPVSGLDRSENKIVCDAVFSKMIVTSSMQTLSKACTEKNWGERP